MATEVEDTESCDLKPGAFLLLLGIKSHTSFRSIPLSVHTQNVLGLGRFRSDCVDQSFKMMNRK